MPTSSPFTVKIELAAVKAEQKEEWPMMEEEEEELEATILASQLEEERQ
jgi:hypothetical protein